MLANFFTASLNSEIGRKISLMIPFSIFHMSSVVHVNYSLLLLEVSVFKHCRTDCMRVKKQWLSCDGGQTIFTRQSVRIYNRLNTVAAIGAWLCPCKLKATVCPAPFISAGLVNTHSSFEDANMVLSPELNEGAQPE